MSLLSVLIGVGFTAVVGYVAVRYRQASDRVDTVIEEPPTVFPRRAPGESFADWADNALATFDDEDTAREYAEHRELMSRWADWIHDATSEQFNAAVVRHLDTPSR